MERCLPHKTTTFVEGLGNKRRKIRKPFWNDDLSRLWNEHAIAQRAVGRARGSEKQRLQATARAIGDRPWTEQYSQPRESTGIRCRQSCLTFNLLTPRSIGSMLENLG